jgi:hypothetical protein
MSIKKRMIIKNGEFKRKVGVRQKPDLRRRYKTKRGS